MSWHDRIGWAMIIGCFIAAGLWAIFSDDAPGGFTK
jgi:hypothetical protein